MRRGTALLLVVGGAMVAAVALPQMPEALASVEAFRVGEVRVVGSRYLTPEEIIEVAGISPGASVWDDLAPLARRIREHPGVREVRIARRLPGTLLVEISESEPVALYPDPVLVPVDGEGRLLPVDPAVHRMDLPIIRPRIHGGSEGTSLTPGELRILAMELRSLGELSPDLLAAASDIGLDGRGDVLLRLGDPPVALHYRPPMGRPPMGARRLEEGLAALTDVLERRPDRAPVAVDLRFEDQVVVRLSPSNAD